MTTERTMLIDALIRVTVLFLTAILIPSLKGWIERNKDNKELDLVMKMADIAVRSVADDLKTETGQAKKAEALSRLVKQVESWGVKGFTTKELDHYIGTAYKEMEIEEMPELYESPEEY